MSKKEKKAAKSSVKREASQKDVSKSSAAEVQPAVQGYLIRAIRITPEILDAAKAYKKAKGVSFYRLGLEAITDRLKREGYLKAAEAGA